MIKDIIEESNLNDKFYKYEEESLNSIIKNNISTIDELEQQWNEFNNMVKEKRRESDDMSLMLTGMTNQQRYEIQLQRLMHDSIEESFQGINNPTAIEMAKKWITDSNLFMVYPDKDVDELYNKYLSQPYELQRDADEMCIQLFGCNNIELYNIIKNSEKTVSNIDSLSDYELDEKLIQLENSSNNDNDFLDYHFEEYAKNKIIKEIQNRYNDMNRIRWVNSNSPYFTPNEVHDLKGFYSESVNETCNTVFEEYEKCYNGFNNSFDPIQWDDMVRKLFYLLDYETNEDKINQYKQSLVDIGWNPEIPYNIDNRVKAKQRLENCINEEYKNIEIINIEGAINNFNETETVLTEKVKEGYYPIHIVLVRGNSPLSAIITKFDRGPFSHSALCLDNDFTRLYSFNLDAKNKITSKTKGGISLETIKGYPLENRLGVYTFFVTEEQYKVLEHNIQQMLLHTNETEYSVLNLFTMLFKDINLNFNTKLICSQFVDKMLKLANIDITNKPSDKVTPNTFYSISALNSKIYKTYDGTVEDFDYKKAQKFVEKMSTKAKFINESTQWGPCPFSDKYEIPYITEAKPIIRFSKEGDVLLDTPHVFIDVEQEYYNSHKLLIQYEKSNNYEGMKYELCRLYYMIHLVEKRIYGGRNLAINKSKEDLIKTRAKILNDFNKYMKILLKNQPKFNFGEYYEQSKFYPHTLELDKNTIKFTTKLLKSLIN